MSAAAEEQPPVVGEVLQIGKAKRDTTNDRVQFQWNDDPKVLVATRPKQAVLVELARSASRADAEVAAGNSELALGMITVLDDFVSEVFDPETEGWIRAQLVSPESEMDYDDLEVIMDRLMGVWYRRPTGAPSGSSGSPRRTGRRSTVRARTAASTPSS